VLNRRAIELKARDAGEADARYRINFGLYFYSAASRGTDGGAPVADPNGGPGDA
jgi:hypothetical protein